jgi:hypothetical protein
MAIAGIAAGVGTAYGAHAQSSAAGKAAKISGQGTDQAIAFEREQAAEDRRRYDQQQMQERAQWDAEQARRAPYRAASAAILSRRTGVPVEPYAPTFAPTMGNLADPSQQQQPPPKNRTLGALVRRY